MKLKKYLKKVKSLNRWCEENDIAYATGQRHIEQNRPVRRHNAHKIHRATDGKVGLLELTDPK